MAVRRCEQHRADEATVHTRTRMKIGPCARGEIDSSLAPAQKTAQNWRLAHEQSR